MSTEYFPLSPAELTTAGRALFGVGWRSDLAAALGVDERDVAMAEIGTYAPPAEWRAKLIALAQETAHRALQTAGNLLWRDDECAVAGFSTGPTLPRFI